jgi:diphosphomevalonate decarboxylase
MNTEKIQSHQLPSEAQGSVCRECPSNIALVKYWGKKDEQIPINPSLSFTLRNSVIKICLKYDYNPLKSFSLKSFKLNGQPEPAFFARIEGYLKRMTEYFPFLKHTEIEIDSRSNFPHSAGIASSAAAFSALALCLCSMEATLTGTPDDDENFYRRASFMARLGSGSACRSIYGGMVLWGQFSKIPLSSDMHAIQLDDARVNPLFMTLRDAVLIVEDDKKAISSSQGHALMQTHPYKSDRLTQANENLGKLLIALAGGNTKLFAEVVENEALSLHSLMMSSNPGYVLMKPNTLTILDKIRAFREDKGIEICFTMDAGPNVHLLYFEKDKKTVVDFINSELAPLCKNNQWIDDALGNGPNHIKK